MENEVVNVLNKNYKVNTDKVTESVTNCRLDRFHALYYLTLKNEKQTGRHISTDKHLDEFKKQRKSSLLKLEPIRTPTLPKKNVYALNDDPIISMKTSRKLETREVRRRPAKLMIDPS